MASVNQLFINMLNRGIESTEAISDPEKKALVYAELAKSLAMTGLVTISESSEEKKSEQTKDSEALKEKPKPKQKATPKKTKPAEPEVVEEWTEEMVEMFSEQLSAVEKYQEEYEESVIDECVSSFSEGVLKDIGDISPLNIDGFLAYMKMLEENAEEAE